MKVVRAPERDTDTSLPLTPQDRQFAEEFFAGQHAGNGTRSYLAIHPESSYDTASVEASELLKQPRIRKYLALLHEKATELTAGRLIAWVDLLPTAQAVIVATAQGRLRNRLAYEAAVYLTNRVMGTPVASHEVNIRDHDRITRAVHAFTKRLADDSRRRSE